MWMVGCSDHGNNKEMKIPPPSDPAYARKLRPLMPRPISSCTNKTTTLFSTTSTTPCFCCIHNPNIISWNHSLGGGGGSGEYGGIRREMTNMPLVSTRWNPTPEQLQALEEMYRRGTRTPSAEQIQQIAVKLRKFGKIEGKNVFYWFQNHKARERQKKRRQLELQAGKKLRDVETTETKPSGLNKRFLQIEQPKKLPTLSNCTTTPPEDSASMHGTVVSEFKRDGWTELNQTEFHNQIITTKNQNCFWKLDSSSCNDTVTQADNNSINLINNYSAGQENIASPFGAMFPPKNEILEIRGNQTLQLFPIRSNDDLVKSNIATLINIASEEEETQEDVSKPKEFIEFLPTRI